MDPISVFKTLWRHKWVAMPVVVVTIAACVYVMFFAQRTYQAHMTYALITPKVPTAMELETSPQLAKLNGDNPYLRSPDNTLLSQVLITKLGPRETAEDLAGARGWGPNTRWPRRVPSGRDALEVSASGETSPTGGRHGRGSGKAAHHHPARRTENQRRRRKLSLFRARSGRAGPGGGDVLEPAEDTDHCGRWRRGAGLRGSLHRPFPGVAGAGRRAKEKPARHAGTPDSEALNSLGPGRPAAPKGTARDGPSDVDLGLLGGPHRVAVRTGSTGPDPPPPCHPATAPCR